MKMKTNFLFFLLICFTGLVFCQNNQSQKEYYNWFDEIVGADNTNLFSGIEYREEYRKLKENTNFFISPKFLTGSVNYDGESYFDIEMKYDVYEQELIIRFQNRGAGTTVIKLIKNKVKEFTIDKHRFVQLFNSDLNRANFSGFYEVLSEKPFFTVFKQHKKNKEERFYIGRMYDDFKTLKTDLLILHKNKYHEIKNKKELLKLFPEFKKELKVSFNKNKNIQKSNPDLFIVRAIEDLGLLFSNQESL